MPDGIGLDLRLTDERCVETGGRSITSFFIQASGGVAGACPSRKARITLTAAAIAELTRRRIVAPTSFTLCVSPKCAKAAEGLKQMTAMLDLLR